VELDNREMSIGNKRQKLLENAKGKYLSFIDDDDDITDAYVEDVLQMIRNNWPVMRLRGQIAQYTFTHSLDNKLTDNMARGEVFLRPPNHLNPMMSDVAKLVRFKDGTRGEDLDWTIRMARAGFLVREYQSDPSRIHYIYNMGTRVVDPQSLVFQQQTSYETMLRMVWTPSGPRVPEDPARIAPTQRTGGLRLGPRGFVSV
jgi:glycosyltransferase involved in cell wall biosynthesis